MPPCSFQLSYVQQENCQQLCGLWSFADGLVFQHVDCGSSTRAHIFQVLRMAGIFDTPCTTIHEANDALEFWPHFMWFLKMMAIHHTGCPAPARARQHMPQWQRHRGVVPAAALMAFVPAQGNTILAMDYMENGTLWDQLPRTNKAGQRIFQWKLRGKKVAYEIALGLHCLHDLK